MLSAAASRLSAREESKRFDQRERRDSMKRVISVNILAALIVASASLLQAAPKLTDQSAAHARVILERIGALSVSMERNADELAIDARDPAYTGSETQLGGLNHLRDDVNAIGRDLRLLEAGEGSLADWERQTFDEILPLMQEIAVNTQKEIQTWDSERVHLWTTAFRDESVKVDADAERVKEIVEAHLKLANMHEQEDRIQAKAGNNQ